MRDFTRVVYFMALGDIIRPGADVAQDTKAYPDIECLQGNTLTPLL